MRKLARGVLVGMAVGIPWFLGAQHVQPHSYVPANGFVPDSLTAVQIAVAVWNPIYGAQTILGEAPYHAVLRDSVWTVEGSLPENSLGGVAIAVISKRDARILRVSHGK